jgi:hypothetical protein
MTDEEFEIWLNKECPDESENSINRRKQLVKNRDLHQGKAVGYDGRLYASHKSQNAIYERLDGNDNQRLNRGFENIDGRTYDYDMDNYYSDGGY